MTASSGEQFCLYSTHAHGLGRRELPYRRGSQCLIYLINLEEEKSLKSSGFTTLQLIKSSASIITPFLFNITVWPYCSPIANDARVTFPNIFSQHLYTQPSYQMHAIQAFRPESLPSAIFCYPCSEYLPPQTPPWEFLPCCTLQPWRVRTKTLFSSLWY